MFILKVCFLLRTDILAQQAISHHDFSGDFSTCSTTLHQIIQIDYHHCKLGRSIGAQHIFRGAENVRQLRTPFWFWFISFMVPVTNYACLRRFECNNPFNTIQSTQFIQHNPVNTHNILNLLSNELFQSEKVWKKKIILFMMKSHNKNRILFVICVIICKIKRMKSAVGIARFL